MNSITISQLKVNPSKVISDSFGSPISVMRRNKVEAYVLGKDLYHQMVSFIENSIDQQSVRETDFTKGISIEEVAKELGI